MTMHILRRQTAVLCVITTFHGSMQLCNITTRIDRRIWHVLCHGLMHTYQIVSCSSCLIDLRSCMYPQLSVSFVQSQQ